MRTYFFTRITPGMAFIYSTATLCRRTLMFVGELALQRRMLDFSKPSHMVEMYGRYGKKLEMLRQIHWT